jgi:hypothetical protein
MTATKTREQQLGDFGEDRALELLTDKGFDVEKMPRNFPFFDLMATRGTNKLLIPVRTRNRFTAKGTLKTDNYNLYTKQGHYVAAKKIADFAGAKIFWVAVTVDAKAKTFSAYMGDVAKLASAAAIPMHPKRDVPNHKCLTNNQPHNEILEAWSNVKGTVSG